jgi:hypothetical protein
VSKLPSGATWPSDSKATSSKYWHPTDQGANTTVGRVRVPSLVELLRDTLAGVEESRLVQPDDPVFMDLKQNLVRAIADLEVVKSDKNKID